MSSKRIEDGAHTAQTVTVESLADTHDLTYSRVLELADALNIRASRPGDRLSGTDAARILEAIGYSSEDSESSLTPDPASATSADPPRLQSVRIRSYRSVPELTLDLSNSPTVLVGPNNSGKTNILRAIELALGGSNRHRTYDRSRDLSFGSTDQQRTGLAANFTLSPRSELTSAYHQILKMTGNPLPSDQSDGVDVAVTLEFGKTLRPRVANTRGGSSTSQRDTADNSQSTFVEELLSHFAVRYIPSAKNVEALYRELLLPALIGSAARSLQPHVEKMQAELTSIAASMSATLHGIGLDIDADLTLPDGSLETLLSRGFDLHLRDPHSTSIFEKGHGIQTTTLLASLLWITEDDRRRGKTSVWLLEEPESYLHPELSQMCRQLLSALAERSVLVITTHALAFVPHEVDRVIGVSMNGGHTETRTYRSISEATRSIREALGIRFADFLHLEQSNVLVEGSSDVDWLRWRLDLDPDRWPHLSRAHLLALGGAQHIRSFLEWTFSTIREECAIVALLDGDEEGLGVYARLQTLTVFTDVEKDDYVVVGRRGFAIEGLVPDGWVHQIQATAPEVFSSISVDSQGEVMALRVQDKFAYLDHVKRMAESSTEAQWSSRIDAVCDALESRLAKQRLTVKY